MDGIDPKLALQREYNAAFPFPTREAAQTCADRHLQLYPDSDFAIYEVAGGFGLMQDIKHG